VFDFFAALFWLSILGMIVGSIKPTWVQHWGKEKTKRTARRWYGLFALLCFIGAGVVMDKSHPAPRVEQVQPTLPESAVQSTPPAPTTNAAVEQAAAEAEEGRKQAEANREKINRETEASLVALAAKNEEAKPDATQVAQQAKEEIKTKVRAFEKELLGYDAVSSMYMENAKAMTRQLGKGAGLGDLYAALKQARQYAQAGANAVLQLRVPDGLPEPATAALKDAKEASWQMMLGRRDALEAFMDWVDNRKPSAQAKMQEQSNFSALQAAKTVECLLHAKTAAGFTEDEIKADLNVQGEEKPAKAKKRK